MIPMTPAALTAPTPAAHMISAPTPGNYLPTTPAAGQMPQTPFMPTGGDYNQADDCKLLVKKPFLYAMCLNIDLPLFISSYSSIYW
jgi:hypothetical protein